MIMEQRVKELEFLQNTLGLEVVEGKSLLHEKGSLPLYLRQMPDKEIFIDGKRVILEFMSDLKNSTPEQLENQKKVLEQNYNAVVVFCFEILEPYERKRLIERRIAFIVTDKQVYIPSMMMNLNEFAAGQIVKRDTVSPATQFLLLYHLQVEELGGKPFGEIPDYLKHYAQMSISRAAKELESKGLCTIEGGRSKSINFELSKRELWNKALPFLSSPIKKTLYTRHLPLMDGMRQSGDKALAYYSSLNEGNTPCIAMGERSFKQSEHLYQFFPTQFGCSCRFEVWKYEPALLSKNDMADPLSMYLCYKDDSDERVQIALNEVLEHVKW